jgi:hypothetical protein
VFNQDEALRLWREDSARGDPPQYSVEDICGGTAVWLDLGGNVGWYFPEFRDGEVVGIRSIAQPRPYPGEPEEVRKAHEYQFKFLSPKRRAKIAHAFLSRHSLATSSDC